MLVQYPFYQGRAVEGRLERRKVIETVAGEPALPVIVDEEKVGVVTPEWKYLRSGDREELYRLDPVPDESRNAQIFRASLTNTSSPSRTG